MSDNYYLVRSMELAFVVILDVVINEEESKSSFLKEEMISLLIKMASENLIF